MSNVDIASGRTRSRPRPSLKKILRKKPRQRFRGTPPPPSFDLDALAPSTLLTEAEVAAACRRSRACIENWRKQPDHPLRWRKISGRILYEVQSLRDFLAGE